MIITAIVVAFVLGSVLGFVAGLALEHVGRRYAEDCRRNREARGGC